MEKQGKSWFITGQDYFSHIWEDFVKGEYGSQVFDFEIGYTFDNGYSPHGGVRFQYNVSIFERDIDAELFTEDYIVFIMDEANCDFTTLATILSGALNNLDSEEGMLIFYFPKEVDSLDGLTLVFNNLIRLQSKIRGEKGGGLKYFFVFGEKDLANIIDGSVGVASTKSMPAVGAFPTDAEPPPETKTVELTIQDKVNSNEELPASTKK